MPPLLIFFGLLTFARALPHVERSMDLDRNRPCGAFLAEDPPRLRARRRGGHVRALAAKIQRRLDRCESSPVMVDVLAHLGEAERRLRGRSADVETRANFWAALNFVDFVTPARSLTAPGSRARADLHRALADLHAGAASFAEESFRRELEAVGLSLALAHDEPDRISALALTLLDRPRPLVEFANGDDDRVEPFTASALAAIETLPPSRRDELRTALSRRIDRLRTRNKNAFLEFFSRRDIITARRNGEILLNMLALSERRKLIADLEVAPTRGRALDLLNAYEARRTGRPVGLGFDRTFEIMETLHRFVRTQPPGHEMLVIGSAANGAIRSRWSDLDVILSPAWNEELSWRMALALDGAHFNLERPVSADGAAIKRDFGGLQKALGRLPVSVLVRAMIPREGETFELVPRSFGDVSPITFRITGPAILMSIFDFRANRLHTFDVTETAPAVGPTAVGVRAPPPAAIK